MALSFDIVAVRLDDGTRVPGRVTIASPELAGGAGPPSYACRVSIEGFDQWSMPVFGASQLQALDLACTIAKVNLVSRANVWRYEDEDGNALSFDY